MINVYTLDDHITEIDRSVIDFALLVVVVVDHWDILHELKVSPFVMESEVIME
jgi:hypothetical protein